ncbi:MAG: substrate-binding domain-containing protein [Paracoccaceae bacterium]
MTRRLQLALWAGLLSVLCVTGVTAQEVSLYAVRDGVHMAAGPLLGFDGAYYRINAPFGPVLVDAQAVDCRGAACPDPATHVPKVTISGARSIGNVLMPALLQAFAQRERLRMTRKGSDPSRYSYHLMDPQSGRGVAQFAFHLTTTDEGFADLLSNAADMVLARRAIRPHEAAAAKQVGLGDLTAANRSRVLALDALVPVVSPGNPLARITLSDLGKALSGQITTWHTLGAPSSQIPPDTPLRVHLPDAGSGLAQAVVDRLLTSNEASMRADVIRHDTHTALDTAVANDPHALGVTSYAQVRQAQILAVDGACGFVQDANRLSIKTEDYPTTTPLLIYIPTRRLPQIARDFLAFTRSPGAQIVIRRAGFFSQTPEPLPLSAQGVRLSNAIAVADGPRGLEALKALRDTLITTQRLTTSFRFAQDGSTLDAPSLSNIQQLARALERGDYGARDIVLAGFSDGTGTATANKALSQTRAATVLSHLRAAVDHPVPALHSARILGFGAVLPMACDDTPSGRHVNRRVEVWVQ